MKRILFFTLIAFALYTSYIVIKRPGQVDISLVPKKSIEKVLSMLPGQKKQATSYRPERERKKSSSNMAVILRFAYGDVHMKRGEDRYNAIPKTNFEVGDTIYTGSDSFGVIEFGDNSRIKLSPNSEFVVNRFLPKHKNPEGTNDYIFDLKKGQAFFDFTNPNKESRLDILTAAGKVWVKGTQFIVEYDPQNTAMRVAVDDGTVRVENYENESRFVTAATGIEIVKGQPLQKAMEYPWVAGINWDNYYTNLDSVGSGGVRRDDIPKESVVTKVIYKQEGAGGLRYMNEDEEREHGSGNTGTAESAREPAEQVGSGQERKLDSNTQKKLDTLKKMQNVPLYGDKIKKALDGIDSIHKNTNDREAILNED